MEYDGGCSLEKDLVFSSQWHVSEAHVYTLGVQNMMEGGWLFRECVHSRSVEYDGGCSLEKDL